MANNVVTRFFGGSPLMVLVRLILLSILVGVILHLLGFDPWNILPSIKAFVLGIWNMGFGAVEWLWRIFLLGAIVVIPIWLIIRLVRAPRGR
jgi:Family of unknown function (DUF6460)